MGLTDPDRILKAVTPHVALVADLFGPELARCFLLFSLGM